MPTENPTYLDRAVEALARRRFENGHGNPDGLPWREADAKRLPIADELRTEARGDLEAVESAIREDERRDIREAVQEPMHNLATTLGRGRLIMDDEPHDAAREFDLASGAVNELRTVLSASALNASPETQEGDSGQGEDGWPDRYLIREWEPGGWRWWIAGDKGEADDALQVARENELADDEFQVRRYQPAPGGEDR